MGVGRCLKGESGEGTEGAIEPHSLLSQEYGTDQRTRIHDDGRRRQGRTVDDQQQQRKRRTDASDHGRVWVSRFSPHPPLPPRDKQADFFPSPFPSFAFCALRSRRGGLDLLFSKKPKHQLELPTYVPLAVGSPEGAQGRKTDMRYLIFYLAKNLLQEREELFREGETV